MNRYEVTYEMSSAEAMLVRTALHIATRLTLHAPGSLYEEELGRKLCKLNSQLADSGADIHPNAVLFGEAVLNVLHDKTISVTGQPVWTRDVVGGTWSKTVIPENPSAGRILAEIFRDAPSKRWKVQFDVGGAWGDLGSLSDFSSRNAAYRRMRKRVRVGGLDASLYRVVPQDTPEGRERDRGFYTVQFMFTQSSGWKTSTRPGLGGRFPTADAARAALHASVKATGKQREKILRSYRIKWHPSRA